MQDIYGEKYLLTLREGASVMEGLSDSDAVLSPVTEMGKKGLSRKSLRRWYNSTEVSVQLMGSVWTKNTN